MAAAHKLDLKAQGKHDVRYLSYWFDYQRQQAYEASAFRTILFTDIVGSTALTQRLGDAGAMTVLRRHDDAVRDALRESGGREIKHTGDGIMASFTSASRAVGCALAIQDRFAEQAVQLAARLCASADPGGILVSHAVRELCAGKALEFDAARDLELRGFAEAVRAYATLPKRGPGDA